MLASVIIYDGKGSMYALQFFPELVSMSTKQIPSPATLSRIHFTSLLTSGYVTLVIKFKSEPQRAGKPVDTYCTQRPSCTLVWNRRTFFNSAWIWTASSTTTSKILNGKRRPAFAKQEGIWTQEMLSGRAPYLTSGKCAIRIQKQANKFSYFLRSGFTLE